MNEQETRLRWDDMRGMAAEMAEQRMELLTHLRDGAKSLAEADLSREEMQARASEMQQMADEKIGQLRARVGDLGAPTARKLEGKARRHDTAMRERLEGKAPPALVRMVQAYPWAAVELVAVLALSLGVLVGGLSGFVSARLRRRESA